MIPPHDPYAFGGVLLDVRTTEEWQAGHLPNAVHIPIDELEATLPQLWRYVANQPGIPILVYCKMGRRAERARRILQRAGFERVSNVGGLDVEPLRSVWSRTGLLVGAEADPTAADIAAGRERVAVAAAAGPPVRARLRDPSLHGV